MPDSTSISNRALQILGAPPIDSLDDGSSNAESCKACYENRRKVLLRSYPWQAAIKRVQLAADVAVPAFDFARQFTWPAEAVRILPPTRDCRVDWVFEGRKILTNMGAPLAVRFIDGTVDVSQMGDDFAEALAADMAYVLAEEITQSNAKQQAASEARKEAIMQARLNGAIEKGAQATADDTWVSVRRG